MVQITVPLDPAVVLFYSRLADSAGKPLEQVLSDALFKLVISPHLSAMEDDDPQNYKYYIEAIGAWSDISDAEPDKCDTSALETLMSRRRDKLVELSSSEVFTIYERMKEKE